MTQQALIDATGSPWVDLDDIHERGAHNANDAWRQEATTACLVLAEEQPAGFTAEDVHAWLAVNAPDASTHDTRVLGQVFQALQKEGVLVNTGRYVKTTVRRRGRLPVWIGTKAAA